MTEGGSKGVRERVQGREKGWRERRKHRKGYGKGRA